MTKIVLAYSEIFINWQRQRQAEAEVKKYQLKDDLIDRKLLEDQWHSNKVNIPLVPWKEYWYVMFFLCYFNSTLVNESGINRPREIVL